MLIINKKDMREAITLDQVMDRVEASYRIFASGQFFMPERPVVAHGRDTLIYMPCFTDSIFGTKFLTLFADNPAKGLPFIQGLMLLNDADNGKTLAILDGGFLTALRTGAVGGVGMRCFSPATASRLGVIGAGTQGFYQAIYAAEARPIQEICFYDAYRRDYGAYLEDLTAALAKNGKQPSMSVCASAEELLDRSDIVVTTTTAEAPVLPDEPSLLRGKTYIAIGSYKPHMRELPNAIWQVVDQAWTEMPFALEESGDFSQPLADGVITEDRVRYVGDLLTAEARPVPPPAGSTNYFKSVGMGLLDLTVSQLVYEQALAKGWGQKVDF